MRKLQFCLVVFSTIAVLALGAWAQVQNGTFTGTVTDPSGAAIVNAQVKITNPGTGLAVSATTSQSGFYSAKELPPGNYTISVSAPGFRTVNNTDLTLHTGTIAHVDFKMQIGQTREVVEVQSEATAVNVEDSRLGTTVEAHQIANLPLNGRNIYDLIKLAPGAVDTRSADTENDGSPGGAGTVVNGVRQDFNGFTINGVSNKALSGGAVNQPIEDTVEEFQTLTLNMSAQYGNSAGAITNVVTKSGTNAIHGSGFGFFRNDYFDAKNFFVNHTAPTPQPPVRFNQIGGTLSGPILKDKLFFLLAYQHDHFLTSNTPAPVNAESPQWRAAVAAANPGSVSGLLYSTFAPSSLGSLDANNSTLTKYIANNGPTGSVSDYLCPTSALYTGGSPFSTLPAIYQAQATAAAHRIANVIGVTAADQTACPGTPLTPQTGLFDRNATPFLYDTVAIFKSQQLNNLFQGHEGSLRLDYNPNEKNRFFVSGNWMQRTDVFGPGLPASARGFLNPTQAKYPNLQINFVHTFTPNILNEFRAGYLGNILLQKPSTKGVPEVALDDGSLGFGSYSGYPQFFKENVYTYSDLVSISHGNHSLKIGADVRRNIENSEFDVSRPSYYFTDQLAFTGDLPYGEAAGTDPGIISGQSSHLSTNIRHWRNVEFGAFFQDDWKFSKRLTLNLGMRYDIFQRHTELNNLATTFLKGPGTNIIDNITTGAGWLQQANAPLGTSSCPLNATNLSQSILAGVCGPGGFAKAKSLGAGDHNNFGPRIGFAYDVFGDGKMSIRGGYGVSYEGTLYNPLSNSRWNPPYYSFNQAYDSFAGNGNQIVFYGPQSGGAASFTGPPDPANGQGPGANSVGNIQGWYSGNQNLAVLTGIVLPEGIRDPYVHNFFFSTQRELVNKSVLELNYVGTAGHKLFRAEDINRIPGGRLPLGTCTTDTFQRTLCSQLNSADRGDGQPVNATGRLNPNYGTLRNWRNVVNSNYHSLQASFKMQAWRGITANVAYTWSHSIDEGSTWHSGATTANGASAGEGFTTDITKPGLDRGNSLFDIRHRIVLNYVWELPFGHQSSGFVHNVLGGWQWNGIASYQTGAHWAPFCKKGSRAGVDSTGAITNTGCDFNLDGGRNDRPNSTVQNVNATHDQWANGFGPQYSLTGNGTSADPGNTVFTRPCAGCVGNLGRNTFVGPGLFNVDMSLFKNFKVTERVGVSLRWEVFNVLNHTNFQLPGANGSTHNRVTDGNFGQAGGAFDARQQQLGLKINF